MHPESGCTHNFRHNENPTLYPSRCVRQTMASQRGTWITKASLSQPMCGCSLNYLYFIPLAVLVSVFLVTRRACAQISKRISQKSLSVRPAMMDTHNQLNSCIHGRPCKLVLAISAVTQQLKNQRFNSSIFQGY